MALSKQKLKSAFTKFSPLHEEGKTEQEIKAEISKEYDAEATDEIYYAIASAEKESYYTVSKEFRDLNDYNNILKPGDDVTHFDQERLDRLVELGLVEKTK